MDNQQTQTQTTPASSASSSSNQANSNAVSDSPQTTNASAVDTGSVEGKSTASEEAGGAASDGDRQRPGRAERRISELSSKIKELESKLGEQNRIADTLNKTTVNPSDVNFPDYSGVEQITPEILKRDILNTAEQLVNLKMTAAGTELERRLTQTQAVEKSAQAIENSIKKYPKLNPDSDEYDHSLDVEITEAYADVVARDPSYSFTKFIKPFERILETSDTTSKDASTTGSSRGRAANRPSAPTRRTANEFPVNGTTADMEKWFANNR